MGRGAGNHEGHHLRLGVSREERRRCTQEQGSDKAPRLSGFDGKVYGQPTLVVVTPGTPRPKPEDCLVNAIGRTLAAQGRGDVEGEPPGLLISFPKLLGIQRGGEPYQQWFAPSDDAGMDDPPPTVIGWERIGDGTVMSGPNEQRHEVPEVTKAGAGQENAHGTGLAVHVALAQAALFVRVLLHIDIFFTPALTGRGPIASIVGDCHLHEGSKLICSYDGALYPEAIGVNIPLPQKVERRSAICVRHRRS